MEQKNEEETRERSPFGVPSRGARSSCRCRSSKGPWRRTRYRTGGSIKQVKKETPTPQKPLNPGTPPFSPGQIAQASESTDRMECFIQFTVRRELISNQIEKFDNRPENYNTWKAAYKNMTREVIITASEELTGPYDRIHNWWVKKACPAIAQGVCRKSSYLY